MERRLASIPPEEWNNLSIDLTPREYVLDYLREAFPVTLMEAIEGDDGAVTLFPVMVDGRPAVSQDALRRREALIERMACLPAVPGVLDAILDAFGTEAVAEVTGRSRRVVRRDGRRVVERRGASAARSETDAFMSGRKRVLIFSDAGGTGRSYHADLAAQNQQRRVHYLVEPGWRADAAIQGLGRSHRTHQACPPLFRPVTTDIHGEKRFTSTIARRLDSLGALTRGERRTAGAGLFRAEDNLESPWARRALLARPKGAPSARRTPRSPIAAPRRRSKRSWPLPSGFRDGSDEDASGSPIGPPPSCVTLGRAFCSLFVSISLECVHDLSDRSQDHPCRHGRLLRLGGTAG